MKCFQCQAEINPTLVYCSNCGAPVEADAADILEDDERRREETRILQAVRDAKGLLVTGVFSLVSVLVLRAVFLRPPAEDHVPAFRAPYALIEDAGIDPTSALPVAAEVIPLPSDE
jgi:hypothetical protein